ncbi:hypothetical protein GCM10028820_01980 [Tessaracoccus terricola]
MSPAHLHTSSTRPTSLLPRVRNLGLAGIALVALSACGATQAADFTEDGANPSASAETTAETTTEATQEAAPAVEVQPVESGFMTEEFAEDLTYTETVRPEQGTVITPAGTLEFVQVQAVETLTPQQIGLDATLSDGTEVTSYGPADGEVLRVVEVKFKPVSTTGWDKAPQGDLSITVGGAQKHLHELDKERSVRLLVSMPDDGSTRLVVSSEGHDQLVDVLTGERQDDDVAAAYYRANTVQEPHHTIRLDPITFPTDETGENSEVVTEFSFDVEAARLTAWTADGGWAEPDAAWLGITWAYDLGTSEDGFLTEFTSMNVEASIDADGTVTTDGFHAEGFYGTTGTDDERTTWVQVPVDLTSVTIGFSGDFAVEIPYGQGVQITSDGTGTFVTDAFEITFPADG